MASWREGKRIRNVYLGSSLKMSLEQAHEKARKMKAMALTRHHNEGPVMVGRFPGPGLECYDFINMLQGSMMLNYIDASISAFFLSYSS
jgi:hypothetical protein